MTAVPRKTFLFMLLSFLIILLLTSESGLALEIRVLEKAEVTDSKIRLGEVARFSEENDPRVEEIKRIVVAHAPPAGKRYVLDGAFLHHRLGTRLGQPGLDLVLPQKLEVKRLAQDIRTADLERIFSQHVRKNMSWSADKVEVRGIRTPEVISLPRGRLTYSVKTLGRQVYLGRVTMLVTFFVDGVRQRSVRLSGYVDVMQEVVVAKEDLERHQEIGSEGVALKLMNMARLPAQALTRISDAIGMQTVQKIRAGQVILPSMVKRAAVVRRGDYLVLEAESATLKVATTAKALEDGYLGGQVRVANAASGKEVTGRVLGARQVVVEF